MSQKAAAVLLALGLVAPILLPGYGAYIGSYIAMAASLVALVAWGWPERQVFVRPSAIALLVAIALLAVTVPFVYRGPQDLLAPVLLLPVLCTPGLAILSARAKWLPSGTQFAILCLVAVTIALLGGAYELCVTHLDRPGLGNNPIHYATLAAVIGNMALIGIVSGRSAWRYVFLLGPIFGLGAAAISGSRGPLLGSLVMTATSIPFLFRWFWREDQFRIAAIAFAGVGAVVVIVLLESGNQRAFELFETAMHVFRFTGGRDDVRAGLYISSLYAFPQAPIFGHGLGQIMDTARAMFPQFAEVYTLDNLHSDWANFVVMAGSAGLAAYLLLLASPLLVLLHPTARGDRVVVLGVTLLVAGQIAMSVSNAMFGILPQTVLYAVLLGYLLSRAFRPQS